MFNNALRKIGPHLKLEEVNGVTIDSRKVEMGDVYFPLKGEHVDGHDFIIDAVERGASLIFSEQTISIPNIHVEYVESVQKTINSIATSMRTQSSGEIIGITGSNGKTTNKELLAHVLSQKFNIFYTEGNFNSTIGLPISLMSIAGDEDYLVIEMGASMPGEIQTLCEIVQPNMGLITNISEAHIENFDNIQHIAKTKSALFTSLPKSGTAFINMDDEHIPNIYVDANKITYSLNDDADFKGNYSIPQFDINEESFSFQIESKIFAQNILAIYSIAATIGMTHEEISNAIATFSPVKGRCEVYTLQGITIIDDSYNANLESTLAGLEMLSQRIESRKIAVLGDMFELGELAQTHHEAVGEKISTLNLNAIFGIGESTAFTILKSDNKNAKHFANKDDLIDSLTLFCKKGDVIYVKGSRGMQMEEIIEKGFKN